MAAKAKAPKKKATAKATAKATSKAKSKTSTSKSKTAAAKTAAKKKAASKATATKKVAQKKVAEKKAAVKKAAVKKTAVKKAPVKKAAEKKTTAAKKASTTAKESSKKTATGSTKKTATKQSAVRKTVTKANVESGSVDQGSKATMEEGNRLDSPRSTPPKRPVAKALATVQPITRIARPDSPFKNYTPYEPGSDEDYMNEAQLEHFRAILLGWRRELMEEVDRTVDHMRDEAANFPDPADRATQEEEFSIELRTRDRERKLIKKIDQTLERIDQEDYGYCDTCGIEIGLRRLEARPTATQCVDCKALDEIKERQLHG